MSRCSSFTFFAVPHSGVSSLIGIQAGLWKFNSMRCSFLPLLGAIFLMSASVSFSSPTDHNERNERIGTSNIPAGSSSSSDNPNFHALARRSASSHGSSNNHHLPRKRDLLNPSTHHPSPALLQRHNHIMDHLRFHARNSSTPLPKRSLTGDLTILGFRLIWDHADVVVSSSLAYYRTTEYYKNMTILAGGEFEFGPTTQNFIITYGVFRLTFEVAVEIGREIGRTVFPDGGLGQFVQEFALLMLGLTAMVVIGTYRVLALGARVAMWITMALVENVDLPQIVGR